MDATVRNALDHSQVIDLTTTGGRPASPGGSRSSSTISMGAS